ncbi:MAG TPA: hypothetical protein VI488_13080 [Candidatus Angelobacter sp.]
MSPLGHGEHFLQVNRILYVNHEPTGDFGVNAAGHDRPGQLSDGPLDALDASQPYARPGEDLAPLLLPPALGVRLLGMAIADGLALHRRGFALFAIAPKRLAAPVVSVSRLRRRACHAPGGTPHICLSDHPPGSPDRPVLAGWGCHPITR